MELPFADRRAAGRELARALAHYDGRPGTLVLGLPRGGVPVAAEVAAALHAPLDVLVVRKLGHPAHEEYAIGALASGGLRVMNERNLGFVPRFAIDRIVEKEALELKRREHLFRGDEPFPEVEGRTVIVVDDGLATGATMRVAVQALRTRRPARLVAAIPVGAPTSLELLRQEADEVVCLAAPAGFAAVGEFYRDFRETPDDEVRALLAEARERAGAHA